MKIKKGDMVKIMAGKDKGKTGKVAKVVPSEGKIIVEGINIKKKNIRPKKQGQKGHIAHISAPFYAANAMIICSSCGKTARTGYKLEGEKKIRVCKKCGGAVSK